MGGFGSSRWKGYRRRRRVEDALRLSAAAALRIGAPSDLPATALLSVRNHRGEWHATAVYLVRHVGKLYALCPACRQRCRALYLPVGSDARAAAPPDAWACRRCHALAYRSTQERRRWQSIERSCRLPPGSMTLLADEYRSADERAPLPK